MVIVKIKPMIPSQIGDVITVVGPLVLFSLSLLSNIGLFVFVLIDGKKRKFLLLIFLISSFMSGYLITNFLLGLFGFDIGDPSRINENKNTIILFSKLEILFLTLGLIMFSNISVILTDTLFSKVKSILTFLLGVAIIYLNFFSYQFFLEDKLKLSINEYMAQEGPLFDIFVVYFALTVLSEFVFLGLYRKRIKPDMIESYKSSIYGIVIIIVFGVLELFELYDWVSIYPYVPSLLGAGISIFSTTILVMLINRYLLMLRQNKLAVDLMNKTRNSLDVSNSKVLDEISNLSQSFLRIENEIKMIMELPKITQNVTSRIKEAFLKIKDMIDLNTTVSDSFTRVAKSEINEIDTPRLKEILSSISEKTFDVYRKFTQTDDNVKKFCRIKTSSIDINVSSIPKDFNMTQDIIVKLNEYITEIKVMLINISILGSKSGVSQSTFSGIISQEMLGRVRDVDTILKQVSDNMDHVRQTVMKISSLVDILSSKILKVKDIENRDDISDILGDINKFLNFLSNLDAQIVNLSNSRDKVLLLISDLDNSVNELKSMVGSVYNFAQETQLMYEQYMNLISGIEEVHSNVEAMKRYLNELRS